MSLQLPQFYTICKCLIDRDRRYVCYTLHACHETPHHAASRIDVRGWSARHPFLTEESRSMSSPRNHWISCVSLVMVSCWDFAKSAKSFRRRSVSFSRSFFFKRKRADASLLRLRLSCGCEETGEVEGDGEGCALAEVDVWMTMGPVRLRQPWHLRTRARART